MTKQLIPIVLKRESIGCPQKSVRNYHYLLCNEPEERNFYPLLDGSLKTHFILTCKCIVHLCWQFESLNSFLREVYILSSVTQQCEGHMWVCVM